MDQQMEKLPVFKRYLLPFSVVLLFCLQIKVKCVNVFIKYNR